MARIVPIRIMQRDVEEYKRLRQNTLSKIRRTRKKYGVDLSGEIDLRDLESFNTRDDFNQWKEQQQRFTSRGTQEFQFEKNRYGVVARKSEINQIKFDTNRVIKQAEQLRNELKKRTQESDDPTLQERMFNRPNDGITAPKPFDFKTIQSQWHLNRREEQMKQRARERRYEQKMLTMRDNYADIIELDLGRSSEVADRLRNMHPLDFYEMYMVNHELMDFRLWDSDRDGSDNNPNEAREKDIGQLIDKYERGGDDFSLKSIR